MKKEICSSKKYILGIDIGNSSTEVAMATINNNTGCIADFACGIALTTGLKGTRDNIDGIKKAIFQVVDSKGIEKSQISLIRINEAAPVIGDFAMETLTKTIITESTMIGHNPDTPGGKGVSVGCTIMIESLQNRKFDDIAYIVVVPQEINFTAAAKMINSQRRKGINIVGAITQNDDGVLINNRLDSMIPIVDEVKHIDKVPIGVLCAIEVAAIGKSIQTLSNPYGIATVMKLSPSETKAITPVAKALSGLRSAVVIKTPRSDIKEKTIPLGNLIFSGSKGRKEVSVSNGAESIMETLEGAGDDVEINGEPGTVIGGVVAGIKDRIADVVDDAPDNIIISDIFATDTIVPEVITGSFEGEYANENALALAAMVKTENFHMNALAEYFEECLDIPVEVVGVEANMAAVGSLTTPGSDTPMAIVDIGAGSTDACFYTDKGKSYYTHLAGAGNMVSMLINSEMNLNNFDMAENIKKYPLAKVESFFSIRHEDGNVEFFSSPLPNNIYGKVVLVTGDQFIPIKTKLSLEKVKQIRINAKKSILVNNIIRGLKLISPTGSLSAFEHVLMVGGSALDFELNGMVTEALEKYGIVAGRANIMGKEGPRCAVATGLLLTMSGLNDNE